jgi:hypothetical protein
VAAGFRRKITRHLKSAVIPKNGCRFSEKDHTPLKISRDPEKWLPVFGKDHTPPKISRDPEKWLPVFGERSHAS